MAAQGCHWAREEDIKAKAILAITGDRYEADGVALIDIEKRSDSFFFSWQAQDSAETEVAQDSKGIAFTSMDRLDKPHPYLEQYIRTHIQKTQLKRKNRIKVVEWVWLER